MTNTTETPELHVALNGSMDIYQVLGSVVDEPGLWLRNTRSGVERLVLREDMYLITAVCGHGYTQYDSCPSCDAEAVSTLSAAEETELSKSHSYQLGRALGTIRQLTEVLTMVPTGMLREIGIYCGPGDTLTRALALLDELPTHDTALRGVTQASLDASVSYQLGRALYYVRELLDTPEARRSFVAERARAFLIEMNAQQ